MTKILPCKCKNDFQDKTYGPFRRVMNYSHKKKGYSCTVCGVFHNE